MSLTANYQPYPQRITLSSSRDGQHIVVDNIPNILPTIYPSDDIPRPSALHIDHKIYKDRANVALEPVISKSTLVAKNNYTTFS